MTSPEVEFRICTECDPHHAENCPKCFGWGFLRDGGLVNGSRLESARSEGDWVRCPVCGGLP
jgi:hypothetical protein